MRFQLVPKLTTLDDLEGQYCIFDVATEVCL